MRYLLFGSNEFYYAQGGAHDLLGAGDSIDDLSSSAILQPTGKPDEICWWHIFDIEEKRIISGSDEQPYGAPNLGII